MSLSPCQSVVPEQSTLCARVVFTRLGKYTVRRVVSSQQIEVEAGWRYLSTKYYSVRMNDVVCREIAVPNLTQ